MSKDNYKTAVFSGRFDPPHLGHIFTIMKLAKRFSKVVVVVLDYPRREVCTAEGAKQIFDYIFDIIFSEATRSKVDVVINNIHFGKITFEEYDTFLRNLGACYNHTVYLSGNQDVLNNFKQQQIRCEFVERSNENLYTGTGIRGSLAKWESLSLDGG